MVTDQDKCLLAVDLEKPKEVSLISKAKKLYRNIKPIVEEKLYFKYDGDNVYCFLEDDIKELKKEDFVEETIKIKKGSWNLLSYIETISSKYSHLGMKLSNDGVLAENTIRYLMKDASFVDLKLDNDSNGHEKISDSVWSEILAGDDFLPATVLITTYRAIKKHNIM